MSNKDEVIIITKEKFLAYVKVQESGVTNMFDVKYVCELSGLDKEEVVNIMQNYAEYRKEYMEIDN